MASNCKNCGCSKINCGCKDSFLTTPAPCPTPVGCPDPQPCSEVFDAQCIVYTGDPIICDQDTVVATNDTVAEALNQVVDYFCENSGGGTTTIVQAGANTTVTSVTVGSTTTYTVASKEAIVAAGTGISVSAVTVGSDTTYTVNAACPMDVEIVRAGVDPDYFQAQVTGGIAPYTYVWSFPSTHNGTSTSPNNSMYELAPVPGFPNRMWISLNITGIPDRFDACSSANTGFAGLLKLVVTDANGCKAKDFHFITEVGCT